MTDTLIEKLEQAEEGSRALSDEVLLVCGWEAKEFIEGTVYDGTYWRYGDRSWTRNDPDRPDPTRSLDDCLRYVVPEGMTWQLTANDAQYRPDAVIWKTGEPFGPQGFGSTPALALTIAALKARAEG